MQKNIEKESSAGSVNDPLTAKPSNSNSGWTSALSTEAIAVLYLTAAAYLFAYAFKYSYLGFFGVADVISSIGVGDIIRSGFYFVALLMILLQLFGLPVVAFKFLFFTFVLFRFPLLLLAIAAGTYYSIGVGWVGVGLLGAAIAIFLIEVVSIVRFLYGERKFSEYLEREIGWQLSIADGSVDGELGRRFGQTLWTAMIFALLLPILSGFITGKYIAFRQREFLVIQADSGKYVVLTRQDTELIVAKLSSAVMPDEVTYVTDEIQIIQVRTLGGVDLVSTRFPEGLRERKTVQKKSFQVWFGENFGEVGGDNQRAFTSPAAPSHPSSPASPPLTAP
jgi:hypothetical protein